jgi:hypothetical protein
VRQVDDCFAAWNGPTNSAQRATIATGSFAIAVVTRYVKGGSEPSAAADGCTFIFRGAERHLSLTGVGSGPRLVWDESLTVRKRANSEPQVYSEQPFFARIEEAGTLEPGSATTYTVGSAPDRVTVSRIEAVAMRLATAMGDDDPDSGRAYATTRKTANLAAAQAEVDSDQPVYLIVLRGDFVAVGGPKLPPGNVPDATGHILRLVWDPATNMTTDFGIGDNEPNTAKLGNGFPLDLPSGGKP